jgi:glycosyltransferase involved in cell wall biosynthesis
MSTREPKFTVITVTYNSSKYVRSAIESVLASSFDDFEYIIGDDCSSDNTWEIIQEYSDCRIVKYRNEVNLREYPNRNKAIEMAKGEWILFIDGDDVIFPHGLSVFNYFLTKYKNSNTNMFVQKNFLNNVIWPINLNSEGFLINEFFGSNRLSSSSFASNLFRKKALDLLGNLSVDFKTGDDDIRLRLGAMSNTVFIPGWLTWPRETPGQASRNIRTSEMIIERAEQIMKLLNMQDLNKDLIEIIELGYEKLMRDVKLICFNLLIRAEFKEVCLLLKFFGLKKILFSKKIQNPYVDFLIPSTPEHPLRYVE